MPKAIFSDLKKIQVCGQRLNATLMDSEATPERKPHKQFKPRGGDRNQRSNSSGRGRSDNAGGRKPPRRHKK